FFATARSPSKSGATAYRCLQRWLLRSVRRTVFVSSTPFIFPVAPAQYVFCDQICFIIIFYEIMFMIYVLSSILESCMLYLILVMINLVQNLNLQLSIFPTISICQVTCILVLYPNKNDNIGFASMEF